MSNPFSDHPASVGESYFEHFFVAAWFGLRMAGAGIACLVHAIFPFLFVKTGGDCLCALHDEMMERRHGRSGASLPRTSLHDLG